MAVSPADARVSVFETVSEATRLWIKGQGFSLQALLGDANRAAYYSGCSLAIMRLSPQDYHRFHCPFRCRIDPGETTRLGTAYYTVNPMAVRQNFDVYTDNVRSILYLHSLDGKSSSSSDVDSGPFGTAAYVAIGAMVGVTILIIHNTNINS